MVCVLDLVELDELALELVAGADAADRPLAGASVNEHADPTPWLRGGELLMCDGLELHRSKRHIDAYVDRIVAAGVAGPSTVTSTKASSPSAARMPCS